MAEVFIFYNRFRTKIKLLHAEPGGLVLYEKLLEEGKYSKEEIAKKLDISLVTLYRYAKINLPE